MSALTRRQTDLLAFLKAYHAANGIPPSFIEMRDALGLTSKSGVHRLVASLEERGYIRRMPNRARAIEIVPNPRLPVDDAPQRLYGSAGPSLYDVVILPLHGRIS